MIGLFVVPSDLDALKRKGVLDSVLDRDEEGFLARAVTIHPFAQNERVVDLAPNHRVYEFVQPPNASLRIVSWIRYLIYLITMTYRIRRIIHDEGVTFVRAQDPYFSGLLGFLASRFPRRPFCISIHSDYDKMDNLDPIGGAPKIFGSRYLAKKLERALLRRADRVLIISQYIGAYAMRSGASAEALRVFRHTVDFEQYGRPVSDDIRAGLLVPTRKPVISAICRLSRQKFVYDIVELAAGLGKSRDDFTIVLAGGGEEEDGLRSRVAELGLSDKVTMPGFLVPQSVAALRQMSTVNLCLLDGRSLLEACAAGRPVVAYDVEWHSEILRDGETGFLVGEGDVEGLVRAVTYLLDNPVAAEEMGRNARARVLDMFDRERLLTYRRQIYSELLTETSIHSSEQNA